MKKLKNTLVLLLTLLCCTSSISHKFYVSITEIEHDINSNTIQCSMKLFTDDFELALNKHQGHIKITDQKSLDNLTPLIEKYMSSHFGNKLELPLQYIGGELNFDIIYLYFESEPILEHKKITFKNSVLMDVYKEQVNIVNWTCKAETKSYLFQESSNKKMIAL